MRGTITHWTVAHGTDAHGTVRNVAVTHGAATHGTVTCGTVRHGTVTVAREGRVVLATLVAFAGRLLTCVVGKPLSNSVA